MATISKPRLFYKRRILGKPILTIAREFHIRDEVLIDYLRFWGIDGIRMEDPEYERLKILGKEAERKVLSCSA